MRRTINFWFVNVFSNIGELCLVQPRYLTVRTRRNGTEYVVARSRGKQVRVTLDTPTEVFITHGRRP